MKKNDWIFLATVLVYSILFYKQMAGLNFFIFSGILISGQMLMRPAILKNRQWIFSALAAVLSSFCVLYYGNTLSILASFVSLMLSSYFVFEKNGSVLIGILSSFISISASIGFMMARIFERQRNKSVVEGSGKKTGKRIVIVLLALIVVLIFFFMYRESSVLFYQLTQKINLDWISFGWIGFTLLGALIVYGFYFHNSIPGITEWDGKRVMDVSPQMDQSFWDKLMSMDNERFSGLVLFSLLNILLLIVNFLDISFIFNSNGNLPQGISCKEYVHQGVGMLIASIVFAMLIILYFFRGRLNFSENGKALRYLALLWIIQNAFMLYSTAWRNDVYVLAFGLTYKRIGVFVYLLLTLIGLIVTAWKVSGKKTNAFLIRTNSWLFFAVWIISCFFNWDAIVFKNNTEKIRKPDLSYLVSLSDDILPQLLTYSKQHSDTYFRNLYGSTIQERVYAFLDREKYIRDESKWPSYRIEAALGYDELKLQTDFGKTVDLNLDSRELKRIYYFAGFDSVQSMELADNNLRDMGEISKFRKLESLDLSSNPELKTLSGIEQLDKLTYLSIAVTGITDFSPLMKLKNLKKLTIGNMSTEDQDKLKQAIPGLEIDIDSQRDFF